MSVFEHERKTFSRVSVPASRTLLADKNGTFEAKTHARVQGVHAAGRSGDGMNNSMIVALVGLWVSGFIFGVVFGKIRYSKRIKLITPVLNKDDLHDIVKKQADEIRKECILTADVKIMLDKMRNIVMNMKSDRMSGDTDLIRRNEVVFMINQFVKDVCNQKHWGEEK